MTKLLIRATGLLFLLAFIAPLRAGEISSEYTKLNTETDCTVFSSASEGDGDWANLTCNGYRGYPILIYYSDLRESLHYGFPPSGDLAPKWESFGGFNSTSGTIEWRIETDESGPRPFATIHRWTVSDVNGDGEIQVLVVEKVAGPGGDGCVVGYVVATGNGNANQAARDVADDYARDFSCGFDETVVHEGSVALPPVFVSEQ
ncbi:MAG: hypothetical protein AB3N20_00980 [Rhizobiaceae bacterium]